MEQSRAQALDGQQEGASQAAGKVLDSQVWWLECTWWESVWDLEQGRQEEAFLGKHPWYMGDQNVCGEGKVDLK